MESTEIRERVRTFALEVFELDHDELDDSVDFYGQGGDSLQRLELFTRIERDLGFRIPDERTEQLRTVDDVVAELTGR